METSCELTREYHALVKSCSECNLEFLNGEPNIKGAVHRQLFSTPFGLDCRRCPVFLSMSEAELKLILDEFDGME